MYATNNLNLNHFVRESQRADAIVAAHHFYIALRDKVHYWFAYILLGLSLPLVWLMLYIFRRRLQKRLPTIQLTTDNYAELRQERDLLTQIHTELKEVGSIQIQQFPYLIRIVLKEVMIIHKTIGDVVMQLKTAFDALDQNRPKSVHNVFTPISGDTLWQSRPKNYAYRL
jgi:thiosulfate reductase cytochrome b subunit